MKYEIKAYRLEPPFNTDREYLSIYRDGVKTNFWTERKEEQILNKYLQLLQSGVIDAVADDPCASCIWEPNNVVVYHYNNIPVEIRQKLNYSNKLFSISGSNTDGREKDFITRANGKHTTQYSKVLNQELTGLLETCCIILFPFGVDYYAI